MVNVSRYAILFIGENPIQFSGKTGVSHSGILYRFKLFISLSDDQSGDLSVTGRYCFYDNHRYRFSCCNKYGSGSL